jgi:hypothetical protein
MFRWIENRKIVFDHGKGKSVLQFRDGNKTTSYQNPSSRFIAHASSGRAGLNSPVIASITPPPVMAKLIRCHKNATKRKWYRHIRAVFSPMVSYKRQGLTKVEMPLEAAPYPFYGEKKC